MLHNNIKHIKKIKLLHEISNGKIDMNFMGNSTLLEYNNAVCEAFDLDGLKKCDNEETGCVEVFRDNIDIIVTNVKSKLSMLEDNGFSKQLLESSNKIIKEVVSVIEKYESLSTSVKKVFIKIDYVNERRWDIKVKCENNGNESNVYMDIITTNIEKWKSLNKEERKGTAKVCMALSWAVRDSSDEYLRENNELIKKLYKYYKKLNGFLKEETSILDSIDYESLFYEGASIENVLNKLER